MGLALTWKATQELVTRVPLATESEFRRAVSAAQEAFPSWRNTPVTVRQRVMLRYQAIVSENIDVIAKAIVEENGKTFVDAQGDVTRGLGLILLFSFVD